MIMNLAYNFHLNIIFPHRSVLLRLVTCSILPQARLLSDEELPIVIGGVFLLEESKHASPIASYLA